MRNKVPLILDAQSFFAMKQFLKVFLHKQTKVQLVPSLRVLLGLLFAQAEDFVDAIRNSSK